MIVGGLVWNFSREIERKKEWATNPIIVIACEWLKSSVLYRSRSRSHGESNSWQSMLVVIVVGGGIKWNIQPCKDECNHNESWETNTSLDFSSWLFFWLPVKVWGTVNDSCRRKEASWVFKRPRNRQVNDERETGIERGSEFAYRRRRTHKQQLWRKRVVVAVKLQSASRATVRRTTVPEKERISPRSCQ